MFQDPFGSLNPRMTVLDIISEPLVIHGIGTAPERVEMVKELMSLVGLDVQHLKRYPHSFSGGQRQRIGIARALALKPDLLICDEPVSALDVSIQAQILNLLKDLQQRLGLTYLFISHNLAVVDYIADRIAVMCAGPHRRAGARGVLFRNPVHPYTKALLAAVPEPDPRPSARLRQADGRQGLEPAPGRRPSPSTPTNAAGADRYRRRAFRARRRAPSGGGMNGAAGTWLACRFLRRSPAWRQRDDARLSGSAVFAR